MHRALASLSLFSALLAIILSIGAFFHDSRSETLLTEQQIIGLYGGVMDLACSNDPRCSQWCNINNEVGACVGSTDDPGTCINQTESTQRLALNQQRCLTSSPGNTCTEGANYVNDSCRVYWSCAWSLSAQMCDIGNPSSPCFSFPSSCM